MDIRGLLELAVKRQASDLHLRAPGPPVLRIDGVLTPLNDAQPLTADDTRQAFEQITTDELRRRFVADRELDFSYTTQELGRFRVNASIQRGTISLALRRVDQTVPSIDALELPAICKTLALSSRGLVLVTGPTGSGKSTTLAAMIEHLNQHATRRIVTIEDPIEFVYTDKSCVITQRELGRDTHSFAAALRSALRQDVEVILVGEMRDPETMAGCLTAAETGHLVFSTLHTNSAAMSIDRVIDAFPPHQQSQIRMQLSLILLGILSQSLLARMDGQGRAPAVEVLVANAAVRNLIREGKTHQISNVIQTGGQEGMQTMEQALKDLYLRQVISHEQALIAARDQNALRLLLERA
ncbi:MAG: type IV pili twitching motility protein PilT [Chloroflexi bacterium RBG_19FT_COMBO_62_14]|nr:MAG: type IV pili twitching motility protein PilT [Chloroflexi bacterium RBG_19FT_COMBO_62_14]